MLFYHVPMKKLLSSYTAKKFLLSLMALSLILIATHIVMLQSGSNHLAEAGSKWQNVDGQEQEFPQVNHMNSHLDTAVFRMVEFLGQRQIDSAQKYVLNAQDYSSLYPFLKTGSTRERDGKFIATMYLAGNNKHMNRWMGKLYRAGFQKVDRVEYGEVKLHHGFEVHQVEKIYITLKDGSVKAIEPFGSVLRTRDGFKIWSFSDT